jgi:hypothetical protein
MLLSNFLPSCVFAAYPSFGHQEIRDPRVVTLLMMTIVI